MANDAEVTTSSAARLVSWKEIAAFFQVTVRTAQNWEAERGLPVHRIPGGRGRVYAEPAELLAWQTQARLAPADESPALPQHIGWRRWALGAAILTAALVLFARPGQPKPAAPADYRVEGRALIVLDHHGHEIWRYPFDRDVLSNSQLDALGPGSAQKARPGFLDLDGDGSPELIFPNRARQEDNLGDELYVFSAGGQRLWQYRCDDAVRSKTAPYSRQYYIENIQLLVTPSFRGLLVSFLNGPDEAANVTLFSPQGQRIRRYWHSGHIHHMLIEDLNRDGFPEIYLGGIANFHQAADLVVLDPRTFAGASQEPSAHQILGFGPPVELARLIMPRTRLSRRLAKYNTSEGLRRIGDNLALDLRECPACGKADTTVQYRFDDHLRLLDVKPADATATSYQHAYEHGLIPFLWDLREVDELHKVRYLTGAPLGASK